jgi:hypothetical protein
MPGGDGTGPMGLGSRTGRRLGYCSGFSVPGFMNAGAGRRFFRRGFGRGRGFGFRRFAIPSDFVPADYGYAPTRLTKEEELKQLELDRKDIEAELEEIKKAIEDLKKNESKA